MLTPAQRCCRRCRRRCRARQPASATRSRRLATSRQTEHTAAPPALPRAVHTVAARSTRARSSACQRRLHRHGRHLAQLQLPAAARPPPLAPQRPCSSARARRGPGWAAQGKGPAAYRSRPRLRDRGRTRRGRRPARRARRRQSRQGKGGPARPQSRTSCRLARAARRRSVARRPRCRRQPPPPRSRRAGTVTSPFRGCRTASRLPGTATRPVRSRIGTAWARRPV